MASVTLNHPTSALQTWPDILRSGERLHIAFVAPTFKGPEREHRYDIVVLDQRRWPIAKITGQAPRPVGGVIVAEWDGTDQWGGRVPTGAYQLRVAKPGTTFILERTILVES